MPVISTSQSGFPTTSELGHILKLALPLVLAYMGRIAIGLTDSTMIGRLGPDELGATGLADEYPVLRYRSVGGLVGNPVHCFTHRGISDTSLGYPCHILGDSQRHHHSHGGLPMAGKIMPVCGPS
uniref:MatE protein n=1 Tax=Candidatus Kentrum sp. UNK TaxID=2126344 RepID=A0A451A195_9GAMM|nr:MAG: hypothetical protein BECKUNK1418G_GA0071005_10091 [Candidatus Kentron sp. UNK]VFK70101.1 MAG: hypothetical protein BECKUNK1418H_GA0071006_10241 [Candidatus Kentron sp. UNK]